MQKKFESVEVRYSPISGLGVFALIDFKKDEVVISWTPKARLTNNDVANFSDEEMHHVVWLSGNNYLLMGEPERYVNHSCDPNTKVEGEADVALRDITAGEEITSSYGKHSLISFECKCGSRRCVGRVGKPV